MKLFEDNSLKHLLFHLAAILSIAILAVLAFFYLYLPGTTNHGETITVPDLIGMPIDELETILTEPNLRYEVSDSSYSEDFQPLAILKQYPVAGAKVKENRKIFISINSLVPPTVPMPHLIDVPLQNAKNVLKGIGLKLGNITYVPDLGHNLVLRQYYFDEEIDEGKRIPKGSSIDLAVGNGTGNSNISAYNYIGMDYEEARFLILGQNLKIGEVHYEGDSTFTKFKIMDQSPREGDPINIGDEVELWLSPVEDSETDSDDDANVSTGENTI